MSESKKTVFVVGLGPGGGQFLTVQAQSALQQAEVKCGQGVFRRVFACAAVCVVYHCAAPLGQIGGAHHNRS